MPSEPATKADLHAVADGLRETIRENTREIISFVQGSQAAQDKRLDERFDQVDAKLEAVIEMLAMRRELHNLVRELKATGSKIDESKVFVS